MPLHSIIIPHRNRNRQVYQAIWSIARSAYDYGCLDYEILIVDHRSRQLPAVPEPCRFVICDDLPGVLNKPRLCNLGIEAARGGVLSFVDADMLVGPQWISGTQRVMAQADAPTRLAYRVRHLKADDQAHQNPDVILARLEAVEVLPPAAKASLLQTWFGEYEQYTRAFEAYGQPEDGSNPRVRTPVFGNSQFSIRRDVLGDLRFNEEFAGAGFEDIWMAWAIQQQAGDSYRGQIFTKAAQGMLHIWHGPRHETEGSDWCPPNANSRNQARYYAYKTGELQL